MGKRKRAEPDPFPAFPPEFIIGTAEWEREFLKLADVFSADLVGETFRAGLADIEAGLTELFALEPDFTSLLGGGHQTDTKRQNYAAKRPRKKGSNDAQ